MSDIFLQVIYFSFVGGIVLAKKVADYNTLRYSHGKIIWLIESQK